MSISVLENLRKRFSSPSDGPQPDVAPAKPRVPLKVRAAKASAALSHVAVIGVGAIALHTRPDLITALAGPKSLPLEDARPATALATAKRVPLQAVPVTQSASPSEPSQTATNTLVAPVKRVPPPRVTVAAATAELREIKQAAVAPSETQLKTLPLTVARAVVLPEARLVLAAAVPIATLPALPMSERARDVIRDSHRVRLIKVREREVTALAAAAATPPAATPATKSVAAGAPPLVKWAAMTPEQRAAANAPVKKSTPYTVAVTWTPDQVAAARAECSKLLKSVDIVTTEAEPVKEGACGAPAPVNVSSVGKPKVTLHPSSMMTCPMAAALDKWMTDKVQPAATASFGAPVARLISASSYSCRNRYGSANTPLSEHALVNALDLAGFVLTDGRTVRVKQDWGPVARDAKKPVETSDIPIPDNKQAPVNVAIAVNTAPGKAGLSMLGGTSLTKKTSLKTENGKADSKAAKDEPSKANDKTTGDKKVDDNKKADASAAPAKDATPVKDVTVQRREFLHRVHAGACDVFGTVLGPEANDAHRDHFHLDMKARRHRAYCQ